VIVSIAWIFLAILAYGGIHSFLASTKVKNTLKQQLDGKLNRYYRLFYNLMALISVLPVLALTVALPDRVLYILPGPWIYIAVTMQITAILALVIGLWQTDIWYFVGLRQLNVTPGEQGQKLVVGGLYRWVRHPLYTAGLLFIWLTPRMSVNLIAFNIAITAYIWIGASFEERKLIREFGEPYLEYRQRTPMLFPWRIPK
jgi:protein-S-isoprenylcysteine O-methyltransferase Ste14